MQHFKAAKLRTGQQSLGSGPTWHYRIEKTCSQNNNLSEPSAFPVLYFKHIVCMYVVCVQAMHTYKPNSLTSSLSKV